MLLATSQHKAEFDAALASVRKAMYEWKVVLLRAMGGKTAELPASAAEAAKLYAAYDGAVFVSGNKIIMFIRDDGGGKLGKLREDIAAAFAGKDYAVIVQGMTGKALDQIAAHFAGGQDSDKLLSGQRARRKENHILVIDDDAFYRSVLKKACDKSATVHQSEDGKNAGELYNDLNPDIIFLDIHLPFSYGFLILEEFLNLDFDAFVVMISADGTNQNIAKAQAMGASGFLKKPLEPDKLQDLFRACPSFKKAA
jgi:two-component system chemotaxis response regulator CheY